MFPLGPDRQRTASCSRILILDETAHQMVVDAGDCARRRLCHRLRLSLMRIADAPHQAMGAGEGAALQVDVDGVEDIDKAGIVAAGAIVVGAHLQIGRGRAAAAPARQHVATAAMHPECAGRGGPSGDADRGRQAAAVRPIRSPCTSGNLPPVSQSTRKPPWPILPSSCATPDVRAFAINVAAKPDSSRAAIRDRTAADAVRPVAGWSRVEPCVRRPPAS